MAVFFVHFYDENDEVCEVLLCYGKANAKTTVEEVKK